MKRIVIFCLLGFTSSAVMADDVLEQDAQSSQEQEVVTERSSFDGFYLGAGIGGSFLQNKHDGIMKKQNVNRFTGDIHIGYGRVLRERFYLGLEVLGELTKQKTQDAEYSDDFKKKVKGELEAEATSNGGSISGFSMNAKVRNKAFTPELTLKVGYVAGSSMFYAKGGIARPEAKALFRVEASLNNGEKYAKNFNESTSKIVPVVYLGGARALGNRWNANVEAGYQFYQERKGDKTNGGWKVRAGVTRTFSF